MSATLRHFQPGDGPAFAALAAASPDTGVIAFSTRYHVEPYEYLIDNQTQQVGVVAVHPDHDGLVGAGLVRLGQVQFNGAITPMGYLNTLIVHPAFRRQGIARQLAAWRVRYAQEQLGEGAIIVANIQRGNTGSIRNAQTWATQFFGRITVAPLSMLMEPPTLLSAARIRPAESDDYAEFAEKANRCYAEHQLYPPLSPEGMAQAVQPVRGGIAHKHWWLAENAQGDLLAGALLTDNSRQWDLTVAAMPTYMKALNALLHVIPTSGILRNLVVSYLWFLPQQEQTAADFVRQMRYHWREQADVLGITFDSRSRIRHMLAVRPWVPTTRLMVALRSTVPADETRPIQPYLGF